MSTTLFIGHRGVGKSSLLERLRQWVPDAETFDLDASIEASVGRNIPDIFAQDGEAAFRELERRELAKLLADPARGSRFIALGAGFDGEIPADVRCVWIRRETDARGRVFLDRPRLEKSIDPLDEYLMRLPVREERYARLSGEVLTLREGGDRAPEGERAFFQDSFSNLGGALTVLPENTRALREFLVRRLKWGIEWFELRDDLLSPTQIREALSCLPHDRVLFSFRRVQERREFPPEGILWDWDLDLGPCPRGNAPIVSCHTRRERESIGAFLERLEREAPRFALLKAAPVVRDLNELIEGHSWWRCDPNHRVFLPRTSEGQTPRWKWYRLLQKGHFRLNFIREGGGSAVDQPTLLDWVAAPQNSCHFAAVLGDPVNHSRTPTEHEAFFAERGIPCLAVAVSEAEWEQGALERLRALGLTHAAVTAPLKKQAFAAARRRSPEAERLQSINTLVWRGNEWQGTSTDLQGFESLLEGFDLGLEAAVWGGGGTLNIIKSCLPEASYYSSREGKLTQGAGVTAPQLVVWAAGHGGRMPPDDWRPDHVVDLNYFEDSPGRTYAQRCGAKYISGLKMFHRQAALQKEFWK